MKIISRILRKQTNSFPLFPGKTKQSKETIEEIVCGEEKKSERGKISRWTPFVRHEK